MADKFNKFYSSIDGPIENIEEVTPNDASDLSTASRAINVNVGGAVKVTTVTGSVGTIRIPDSGIFPIRVTRIWATGTTATGIVSLS